MRNLILAMAGLTIGAGAAWAATPREVTPAEQAELATATKGLVPGKAETCMNSFRRTSVKAVGPYLVYRAGSRRAYVTYVGDGCQGVNRGDSLVSQTTQTRFCRGDIIETVNLRTGMRSGGCVFGDFVPYTPG